MRYGSLVHVLVATCLLAACGGGDGASETSAAAPVGPVVGTYLSPDGLEQLILDQDGTYRRVIGGGGGQVTGTWQEVDGGLRFQPEAINGISDMMGMPAVDARREGPAIVARMDDAETTYTRKAP